MKSVKSVIRARVRARLLNLAPGVERDQESVTSQTSTTKTRAQQAVPWVSLFSRNGFRLSAELTARD